MFSTGEKGYLKSIIGRKIDFRRENGYLRKENVELSRDNFD